MPTFDWQGLLTGWSAELLRDPEFLADHVDTMSPEAIASGWVGYPPASEEQIAALEYRIGATLPPSYRAFLAVSNGWRQTSTFIDRVWSTEDVDWFAVRHQDWIDAYAEPAREADGGAAYADELQSTLQVSDVGDAAIYLLNPHVVSPAGEWEAWFFANWVPGEDRYGSFWELMVAQHASYLALRPDAKGEA